MSSMKEHPYISTLKQQYADKKCSRRDFLRTATLLGLSAGAAYALAGRVAGEAMIGAAKADMPKGGTIRIAMPVQDLTSPHTYSWVQSDITRQVCGYLTRTGQDNITRPFLLESWTTSEDLRSWTLNLRRDVNWHKGRPLSAEDVAWNLKRVLDPATGSSMLGLMEGYMLEDYETGKKDAEGKAEMSKRLWDANAIEVKDAHTVVLNLKAPQLAVPEHLFHYPMHILDPEENGVFGVGSNGTGAFELVEYEVGRKAVVQARSSYWGGGPYVDRVEFIDLGAQPQAWVAALSSKQIDGLRVSEVSDQEVLAGMSHVTIYQAQTAHTGVARMQVDQKPFDDARLRKAMRLAVDTNAVFAIAHRGIGAAAEHHHVAQIHPEYAALPPMQRDVDAAKKLLAEAGYPDGIDLEIAAKNDPTWEMLAVQAMVEQWKEAGIRVSIKAMPSALFWEVWDKVPFGFTEWAHRPLGTMALAIAYKSGNAWNESHYANPAFDALIDKAEATPDIEQRRLVMAELETIMQEDGPVVQPLWRGLITGFDSRVQGFTLHPTGYIFAEELAMGS